MKPEISFNVEFGCFQRNRDKISLSEAKKHWENVGSADWTAGAYRRMVELTLKVDKLFYEKACKK